MANTVGFTASDILSRITVKHRPVPAEYREAVTDCIVQTTNDGASTVTLQLTDPHRELLNGDIHEGDSLEIAGESQDGLNFVLVQFVKASAQLQLVFESSVVNRLRQERGLIATKSGTDVTPFIEGLVLAVNKGIPETIIDPYTKRRIRNPNYARFVGPDYASTWSKLLKQPVVKVAIGRGTSTDPHEDSWTCMSRIASAIAWRLWEDKGTVYFGPDEWWAGDITPDHEPYVNSQKGTVGNKIQVLREFTPNTQLIDFDWDVGKAYAQATVTATLQDFQYDIGEFVRVENCGPASGDWMVAQMQRDAFNTQASVSLTVAIPYSEAYDPTSLPVAGFPLPVRGVA